MDADLLSLIDANISAVDARIAELQVRLDTAKAERLDLVKMRALGLGQPGDKKQGRTHAVEELLQQSPRGLRRREIIEAMEARGRTDDPDDLSASLAYLKRNGRAVNAEGVWSAPKG